jgi:hypothetical protein
MQTNIFAGKQVGLRLIRAFRSVKAIALSSSSDLANLSIHHDGIRQHEKLKVYSWTSDILQNVHTKFHTFSLSHSLVIKCIRNGISCDGVGFGNVRLG